jgi:hypothetical protein
MKKWFGLCVVFVGQMAGGDTILQTDGRGGRIGGFCLGGERGNEQEEKKCAGNNNKI